jgi:hypothetical protein
MTIEQLTAELQEMYAFCASSYDERDGDSMSGRLTCLAMYLARTAEMMGDAQYIVDEARGRWADAMPLNMTATLFREWLTGKVRNEQKLYNYTERLNKTITHQMEALRTQISRLKHEQQQGYYGEATMRQRKIDDHYSGYHKHSPLKTEGQ